VHHVSGVSLREMAREEGIRHFNTSPPLGERSIAISVSVCLFVRSHLKSACKGLYHSVKDELFASLYT